MNMKLRSLKPRKKLKPLVPFNAQLIQKRLEGILLNVDRDLERQLRRAGATSDSDLVRQVTLMIVMVRIALNSYAALCVLLADQNMSRKRRNFVLIVPSVNRQLMDLLCTLVYIRDDFAARSLAYERSSYRAFKEEHELYRSRFGNLPEWKEFFSAQKRLISLIGKVLQIPLREKRNPKLIPRWLGPFKLSNKQTSSSAFLKWMVKWMYSDTSAEAHLTGIGLFSIAGFLLAEFGPEEDRDLVENRTILQYHFRHFSRTIMTVLAIATEIDDQFKLNNRTAISYVWRVLTEYAPDAKDMYQERYDAMLSAPYGP
jgi:hypothetical protein